MIKNFFVKTQTIKGKKQGLINYINYLRNNEHKNHIGKTEKILPIWDKESFIDNTLKSIIGKEIQTKMIGKGGSSFQSYRQSFCLSFPTDVTEDILTEEVLIKIYKSIIWDIFKKLDIPRNDENLKSVFGNVHFNNNVHINIVIPKVIGNRSYDFSKKSIMEMVKKSFDNECSLIGLNKSDYRKTVVFGGKTKTKSLERYKMSLERKEIYLQLELELLRLKKQKNEIINHKVDEIGIEIKKEYYKNVNPFIQNIQKRLQERKKTKTININELFNKVVENKPQNIQKYNSVVNYGLSM